MPKKGKKSVGVDGGCGKEPLFLHILDDEGEQLVADVHKDACRGNDILLNGPSRMPNRAASMDRCQIRDWRAWHHHMAMVIMSVLFLLETRREQDNGAERERFDLRVAVFVSAISPMSLKR